MTGPRVCDDGHEPLAYRADAIGCPLCLERAGRPLPARVDGPWSPFDELSDDDAVLTLLLGLGEAPTPAQRYSQTLRVLDALRRVSGLSPDVWRAVKAEAR